MTGHSARMKDRSEMQRKLMPDDSAPILDLADSKIKSWATEIKSEARTQLENLANLPFIFSHIAVMPDVHAGKG